MVHNLRRDIKPAGKEFRLPGSLKSWIKKHNTYSTEDNRGSWLINVLVQSFCGIWSRNKSLKYSMTLISYFHNRPIPIKVKPYFADTCSVRKAHYYEQFALSLGKESPYTFLKFNLLNTDNLLI